MSRLLQLFLVLFSVFSLQATAANFELTAQEKLWISQNPVLTVGAEKDWAPFDFVDNNGQYTGIAKEYLDIISSKTGIRFHYQIDSWNNLLANFKNGKIDLLPAIYFAKEREEFANFTKSYSQHAEFIFVKEGKQNFSSLAALAGKKLVVIEGYLIENYIRTHYPDIQLSTQPSIIKALHSLISGEVDAFANDLASTAHMARQYNIVGFIPATLIEDRINHLHMATTKDQPMLTQILNKVFSSISDDTHRMIRAKWIPLSPVREQSTSLVLTEEEKQWLNKHPIVNISSDPSWMPYEGADHKGYFIGVFSDLTELVAKRLGITTRYIPSTSWTEVMDKARNKQIDFFTAIPTTERKQFLLFSQPIIIKELALITRSDHPIITSFADKSGQKVALISAYGYNKEVQSKFPDNDYIYVNSMQEGLQGLASNQYDIFIANITSSLYYISKQMLNDLQVSGTLDINFEVGFAIRDDWPMMQRLINKALATITEEEHQAILKKWVKVDVVKKVDYSLFFQLTGVFLVILLIIAYWNTRLRKEIEQRLKAEEKLRETSEQLDSILNTANNIIIVTDQQQLLAVNKAFLDFFIFADLNAFIRGGHNNISEYFIADDHYFHLGQIKGDKHWVEAANKLPATKRIVKMRGSFESPFSIFSFNITKIPNNNNYVISFTDITDIKEQSIIHEYQATHDPLTQLYNRQFSNSYLEHEISKFKALNIPLSIILFDIDFFKKVNDNFGHAAGDEILITVGRILKENFRNSDISTRWGGEEFLIILSDTEINNAVNQAEKIRIIIADYKFSIPIPVTCSFGVASARKTDNIDSLIKRADDGLYQAKENGRNQVVSKNWD